MEGAWGFQGNTAKRSMNAEKRPVHGHTLPHTVNSERTHTVRDQAALVFGGNDKY